MLPIIDPNDREILAVASASYSDGEFCGRWLREQCRSRGVDFHQSMLTKLANAGYLEKLESSRRGSRRYYRITSAAAGIA